MDSPTAVFCFLPWSLTLCARGSNLSAGQEPSQAEVENALATVRSVSTSQLDRALPETRLKDWFETQAGSEGQTHWDYQYESETSAPVHFVEAVVTFNKDQSFLVSMDVEDHGQHPSFDRGWVILGKQRSIELKRRSGLPQALNKLRSEWSDREAIR